MRKRHNRKSPRLQGFDYSKDGSFFITIVTYKRRQIFNNIRKGIIELTPIGTIVQEEWIRTADLRPEVYLDEYCIMPDHFHAIICIRQGGILKFSDYQSIDQLAKKPSGFDQPLSILSNTLAQFKASVTRQSRQLGLEQNIWQKRFHDRIIRDYDEYLSIRDYIISNPVNWDKSQ